MMTVMTPSVRIAAVRVSRWPSLARSRDELASRPGTLQILERIGAHSYLALPLTAGGRTLAALVLHANQPRAFDDFDVRFAGEIATAIAIALDHCLGYEAIARFKGAQTQVSEWLFAEAAWRRPFGPSEEVLTRALRRLGALVAQYR